MTGVRLTTRTNLKEDISYLYESIYSNKPHHALFHLASAEKNIVIYHNTRGIECKEFYKIFDKIKNLLKRFRPTNLYKKRINEYILELNIQLRGNIKPEDFGDGPILFSRLQTLSDDLMDDYSEFILAGGQDAYTKNKQIIDLIRNDLLEMRELGPHLMKTDDTKLPHIQEMLKSVNSCLVILTQVNDVAISPTTAKNFRESFQKLFNDISSFFIPISKKDHEIHEPDILYPEGQIEQKKPASIITTTEPKVSTSTEKRNEVREEETDGKSLNKMTKELGIDLKEMERKAKEGLKHDPGEENEDI